MSDQQLKNNLNAQAPVEGELQPRCNFNGNLSTHEQAYLEGFKQGVHEGFKVAIEGVQHVLPELIREEIQNLPVIKNALSEGLRLGSPHSGKALVELYRYGKISPPKMPS